MKFLLWVCIVLWTFSLPADLKIPYQNMVPVPDGKLTDPCWKNLSWNSSFTQNGSRKLVPVQTRFKVFHDRKALYFALEADEPSMEKIKARVLSKHSTHHWLNDSVEFNVVLDPKVLTYYKIIVDNRGAYCDLLCTDDNTDSERYAADYTWKSQAVFKTVKLKNKWIVEGMIPLGTMKFAPETTDRILLNVGRNRYAGEKLQMSSFSVLPRSSHMIPKSFRQGRMMDFDVSDYRLELQGLRFRSSKGADGKYFLTASFMLYNHTGSAILLQQKLNTDSKLSRSVLKKVFLPTGSYKLCQVTLPDALPGKQNALLTLQSNNTSPGILLQTERGVEIVHRPLKVTLLRPAYRHNLYATMKDKTIEAQIHLENGVGKSMTVELSGRNFKKTIRIPKAKVLNRVVFDGSKLPDGTYFLKGMLQNGKELFSDQVRIRVLPYQKGEVYLDQDGVVYVDGKEFFPYGWYGSHGMKKEPFYNSVLIGGQHGSIAQIRKRIHNNLRYGLRTIMEPLQEMDPRVGYAQKKLYSVAALKKSMTEAQKQRLRAFVSQAGRIDGILAWYMADEPEGRDLNPLWFEEARNIIEEYDPYHPCVITNYGINGMQRFYKGADILFPDCYPQYFEDGTTNDHRWKSAQWAKAASALRPMWLMTQATVWPDGTVARKGVPPDYHDQRSQYFQALIYNAKGFNKYIWYASQKYSEMIFGPEEIGKTLMHLQKYLLRKTVPGGIRAVCTPAVKQFHAGVKKYGKDLCILAVNVERLPTSATMQLKERFNGTLHVAGENRSVKVVDGRFTDRFEGKNTHIYLTDKALAQTTPSVAEALKKISDHKRTRRKKGNLAAVGQLYALDYSEYAAGRVPRNVPRIRASSDARYWHTRKHGSLYYLLDGLTQPRCPEYTWRPLDSDKTPWIEIKLPAKAPVKRVLIYTPGGNLKECSVTALPGKTVQAKNPGKNVIGLSLDGTPTDTIRIDFKKYQWSAGILGKRLVTEIEIY